MDEKFCPVSNTSSTIPESVDCKSLFDKLEFTSESTKLPTPDEIATDALTQYDSGICTSSVLSDGYIGTHADMPSPYLLSTDPQSSTDVGKGTPQDTLPGFETCDNERLSHQDIDTECAETEPGETPQNLISEDHCGTVPSIGEDCSSEELFWQEQLYHPESVDKLTESPTDYVLDRTVTLSVCPFAHPSVPA